MKRAENYSLKFAAYGLFLLSVFAYGLDPRTTLVNGTINQDHDYHCVCSELSNTTGKNVLIPWKTATEWASFRNSSYAGLTKAACTTVPGDPPIDFTDANSSMGNPCGINSNVVTITNIKNFGTYDLHIEIDNSFFLAPQGCSAQAVVNVGSGPVATNLVSGANAINICQNAEVQLIFNCTTEATHGPYDVTIYSSGQVTKLDTMQIDFFFYGTGCALQM